MRRLFSLWVCVLLVACASTDTHDETVALIRQEMNRVVLSSVQSAKPEAVNDALLPPLNVEMPALDDKPTETRFDLAVNNTPVNQVFMAIVSGTRYSMLLHPDVAGNVSLALKNVTVFEALETVREMYGYDYKVDGMRIYVQPLTLQTRIFQVNYLTGQRDGTSSLKVKSSSLSENVTSSGGTTTTGQTQNSSSSQYGATGADSSKVSTTSQSNFWEELSQALKMIIGTEEGRNVVISPMSGVIVIRALPDELRNVTAYLKASQISIERQVILEAKIIEVQLNDSFQSGVNWAGFGNLKASPTSRGSFGQMGAGTTLLPNAVGGAAQAIGNATLSGTPGTSLLSGANNAGTIFGLAFQTTNFAALLSFLESQGNVHVLSSPRIATLNNQKAVLKVGTDEFFVTEISGGTQATANVAGTAPTVKVQPFFSGIALDVTPRIDENNEIILHVHPSVSSVTTVNKTLNLGTGIGTYNLPLASSSVSETDSIVRARDGQIVAIGGLMRQATFDDQSGLPGMPKTVFGQTNKRTEKRELVILLKPTVVDNDKGWVDDITQSRDRISRMEGKGSR